MYEWFNAAALDRQLDVVEERWNLCTQNQMSVAQVLYNGLEDLKPTIDFIDYVKQVTVKGRDDSFEFRLRFNEEDYLDIDWVKVDPNNAPYGVGRTVIRNAVDLASRLGFQTAYIDAQDFNGGYAWAKCGFKLKANAEGHDKKVNDRFIEALSIKAEAMRDYLDRQECKVLEDLYPASRLYEVANMDRDIMSNLQEIWQEYHSLDDRYAYISEFINNTQRKSRTRVISEFEGENFFDQMRRENREIKLGQFLLLGMSWIGEIDLSDEEQLKRLDNYVDQVKNVPAGATPRTRALTAC